MRTKTPYVPFARTETRDMDGIPLYFRASYTIKTVRPSVVYVLRLGDTPYVKIGYSSQPHARRSI